MRRTSAATALGSLAVVVGVVVAGCSNAAKSTNTTPAAASSPASAPSSGGPRGFNNAAFRAYITCLQQHGATLPSFRPRSDFSGSPRPRPSGNFSRPPGGGFGGFFGSASADPTMRAAMQACASLRPQGGGFGRRAISATTFAAFKSCMGDNGVTITATDPQQGLRSLNRSDPKTAAALKICQPILGQGGAPPSPNAAPSGAPPS